ncbi:MAG: LacI family DNA-binding transcriptional regulator [Micrococcales bacterium]|nr:LacI family DNA-binding transcriptional regulator [Micrococcales bacterium]
MTPTPSPVSGRPTMRDVARRAGVGVSTVSRVVSGDVRVSPARTAAVRTAIAELGFRRNDSARQLRKGAAASIGLLIESVSDPFFSLITQAVEEVANDRDSLLMSASSNRDAERARKMILAFCARRVDGLIITPPESQSIDYLRQELLAGVRMVFIDRPVPGLEADTVLTDNVGGARAAVEHLIAHGHRRIACFTDRHELFTSINRVLGYRQALEAAGIPIDPSLIHASVNGAYRFAEPLAALLDGPNPPTAVFTGNNRATSTILRELSRRPETLALVGFDDFELADVVQPGVSVIAQDPLTMGRIAANLLFSRLDGDSSPVQTITLRTSLIARGSGEIRA